ncbi:Dorsal-ventral patterning protein Sog [Halotydeus destructor]|nr:Dorsal-ventral patterning protein Sog [Halotydeus destructor]
MLPKCNLLGRPVMVSVVLLIVTTMMASDPVTASRRRPKPPLIEDIPRRKQPHRPSHCQFGNQSMEIEERWRPNLGPPFGVMVCVRCECAAVPRKNRMVAKVKCKNFVNECPKPTCDHPTLLPDHCCKTCPGEDSFLLEDDLAVRRWDPEEEDGKEFSVQMTGKGLRPQIETDFTARGYFSFAKRNLQYFINYSGQERPSFIRFTDDDRNILDESELTPSGVGQGNGTRTICGVWKKVPRVYRGLLRRGKLHIVVTSAARPDGLVGGTLLKNDLLHTASCSFMSKEENANSASSSSSSLTSSTVTRNGNYLDDEAEGNDINHVSGSSSHKCYYEGQIFDDGSQWRSLHR